MLKRPLLLQLFVACILCLNAIRVSILVGQDHGAVHRRQMMVLEEDPPPFQNLPLPINTYSNLSTTITPVDVSSQQSSTTSRTEQLQKRVNRSTLDIPLEEYHNASSPVQKLLKVYVYETLPANISSDLEDYMMKESDSNFVTDLALFNLFRTFPGRTYNPNQADIFVAPYPHIAHCSKADGYKPYCGHLKMEETASVFSYLPYYNQSTAHKHLLFLADGEWQAHRWMLRKPLAVMYGPRWEEYDAKQLQIDKGHRTSPPGHILIPPFNARPEFQPSVILERFQQQQQQLSKKYALTFVAGAVNKIMGKRSARRYRGFLLKELQIYSSIGGMTFIANEEVHQTELLYQEFYPNSILCPVLPGDMPWSRRFFDVMASGCLPFVLKYPLPPNSVNQNRTSWFLPEPTPTSVHRHSWSVEETHPYTYFIDYRSFVVECPGNVSNPEDMSSVVTFMEDILSRPDVIREKQAALQKEVLKVTYGLGPDAHRYEDAFAVLVRKLRTYLDDYRGRKRVVAAERRRQRRRRQRQLANQQQETQNRDKES